MVWSQLEPSAPHLNILLLSSFLILYALSSNFIKNRLFLSEPPLATLLGIIFGPQGLGVIDPISWGYEDNITQEFTRIIVGIQVFAVAVELPAGYFVKKRFEHAKSVAVMLGPVMTFGWLSTALLVYLVLQTDVCTALIVGACLTPTDPVLSASVLSGSKFSGRVPKRLRHLLSAESGCNDGVSFPFLYIGIVLLIYSTTSGAVKEFVLITGLWQCTFGLFIGLVIGLSANRLLRFSEKREYIDPSSFLVFYFLMALFSIGVGSTLGTDDFLVAFGAGLGFAWDGWFAEKTADTHLPEILDLLLNSSMFVYFGAIIPWARFNSLAITPDITKTRLIAVVILILLFRRIPIVLAMKRWIPDIRTYREALFCGHFGPMGLGGLFLAIEARAQLETHTSEPLPHPPEHAEHEKAIETIWVVVSAVVLGSIFVHGLSVPGISFGGSMSRDPEDRAELLGGETERLDGMVYADDSEEE